MRKLLARPGGVTTTFGYDDIGQILSESDSGGYSAGYTYDANGNRLSKTGGSLLGRK